MVVVNLYDNIYKMLVNSKDVLNYLGLEENATLLEKAKKVQKRARPQNLVNNIPLIAFYAPPGGKVDRGNYKVYNTPIVFDIYTPDDVDLAQKISSCLVDLFNGQLHPFCGVESYETEFLTAHESSVDISNVYCFTTVIQFSVTI